VVEPQEDSADAYLHEFSGMRFPSAIEGFLRGDIQAYDELGENISVGYINDQGVLVTVYVYPIPPDRIGQPDVLLMEFQDAALAIDYYFEALELVESDAIVRIQEGVESNGFHLSATGYLPGETDWRHVQTALYIYRYGDWFFKCRATYDIGLGDVGRRAVERLLDALTWPETPPPSRTPTPSTSV